MGRIWLMVGYAVTKGAVIGIATLSVVQSTGLSDFSKAIILALLSGAIGFAGIVTAAFIGSRHANQLRDLSELNARMLKDLKASEGLTRRMGDPDAQTTEGS